MAHEDTRAAVQDQETSAASDDVDSCAAVDDHEARSANDVGAVITAEKRTDLDPDLTATMLQLNGKNKNERQEQNQRFRPAKCYFPCDEWSPLTSQNNARSTPHTEDRSQAETRKVQIHAKSAARNPVEPENTWCYHM